MTIRASRPIRPTPAEEGPAAEVRSFLSLPEASDYLGVASSFIRRLVLERRVTYYKLGRYLRFNPTDLDEFVLHSRVDTLAKRSWILDQGIEGRRRPLR